MTHLKLDQFEGPFDLLLSLIDEKKLEISDIALSDVTEQFLQQLETLHEDRTETLADFLVVASRLLLVKSKLLLAQEGEDDDGPALEDQLRLYRRFLAVSITINQRWLSPFHSAPRMEPPRRPDTFCPPGNVTLDLLHSSMVQLLNRLAPPRSLPETRIDAAVSLKEKIHWIRQMLSDMRRASFLAIIGESRNRTDVIVSFLAILELVKERRVLVKQNVAFSDISIELHV